MEKKMQAKKKYILIQSQDEEDLWEFRKPQSIEIKEIELKELGELEKLILFPL